MNTDFSLVFALATIVVSGAVILAYRGPRRFRYEYLKATFSPVIIALGILLQIYGVIPPVAGLILAVVGGLLAWVMFYSVFFRKKG